MSKVQLTFTSEETNILASKAAQLGYSVTKYVKLLVGREVLHELEKYPTYQLSKKATIKIDKAHKDHLKGKTIPLKSTSDLDK